MLKSLTQMGSSQYKNTRYLLMWHYSFYIFRCIHLYTTKDMTHVLLSQLPFTSPVLRVMLPSRRPSSTLNPVRRDLFLRAFSVSVLINE